MTGLGLQIKTVQSNLMSDIRAKGNRLSTGFPGTSALIEYLAQHEPEMAYIIATQPNYPGWGYIVKSGASGMWETWDGSDSHNHTPFCLISGYFYKYLAGIQPSVEYPGFKHIIINPSVTGDLTYVSAYHDSMYGRIESRWKRIDNKLYLDVVIPANTTATIHIPTVSVTSVTESGKSASEVEGIKFHSFSNGKAVYSTVSGHYRFEADIASR
ncbi:MAG: hypothetical protein LBR06_09390 [Bacteroidales bacterium]|jgi:alpha-L-rhamnosidase|nr:hypothetical protein [Bacteroidales bacterium]